MIHVCIILDKHGTNTDCRSLGSLSIVNDGTGTETRGNYNVIQLDKNTKPIKRIRVENWPRKSKSPMQLVARCFKDLGISN